MKTTTLKTKLLVMAIAGIAATALLAACSGGGSWLPLR